MFDLDQIDEKFPFDEFRDGQKETIEFALNSFAEGKKIVILEAPTGAGKSAIGMTIARFFRQSYYITIQKILQSQIIKDFGGNEVVDLKGRATYPCTLFEREGPKLVRRKGLRQEKLDKILAKPPNCNEGYCRKTQQSFKCEFCFQKRTRKDGSTWGALKQLPPGFKYSVCPYYERVNECINAPVALFNFASFLYQTTFAPTRFVERDLLLVDECHNLEPELLSFIGINLNDKTIQQYGYTLKKYDTPQEYWLDFEDNNIYQTIKNAITFAQTAENIKLADELSTLLHKLIAFRDSIAEDEEWVSEYKDYGNYRTVELKPVFVKSKTQQHIFRFAPQALLMSATILNVDVFCNSLGIDRKDVAAYRMRNRFPIKNRPIYLHSYCKITGGQAKQKDWGPKMLKAADEVIDRHPDEKGIIHTHNFSIARILMADSKHRRRMLFQVNFNNKEEMLKKHYASKNTIIVAPAMHEGLDLRGDLSRFQIIAKVPFPNFYDDKQLARRVEIDSKYYSWLVALKLVQSYGRSVRDENDHAVTYVLDEVFKRFINQQRDMIPDWFLDAIDLDFEI